MYNIFHDFDNFVYKIGWELPNKIHIAYFYYYGSKDRDNFWGHENQ